MIQLKKVELIFQNANLNICKKLTLIVNFIYYFCYVKVIHKLLLFILVTLYSFETFGAVRYIHFCGGEISSDNYFLQHKECCCNESEEANDDCCKDVVKAIQFHENSLLNFDTLSDFLKNYSVQNLFFIFSYFDFNLLLNSIPFSTYQFVDIPPGKSPPIIKLVCSYLI